MASHTCRALAGVSDLYDVNLNHFLLRRLTCYRKVPLGGRSCFWGFWRVQSKFQAVKASFKLTIMCSRADTSQARSKFLIDHRLRLRSIFFVSLVGWFVSRLTNITEKDFCKTCMEDESRPRIDFWTFGDSEGKKNMHGSWQNLVLLGCSYQLVGTIWEKCQTWLNFEETVWPSWRSGTTECHFSYLLDHHSLFRLWQLLQHHKVWFGPPDASHSF